ncbi:J domain-containing protein [Variovorax sp. PMC12]|uniref:J domain-containing protein n=1 Tax=Variovorax sp. PMC12 TaxID=2126319 RepID=UPI00131D6552|nr:J domain-containing protein [Variovorax sp. PMC12]
MAAARDAAFNEVRLLGGRHVVLSTNVPLRQDGKPYANFPRIEDPAAAMYFTYKDKQMCFACDRWTRVEDNIQAIRKTIEALRGIARWGTGDMLQAAFTGFTALPAPIVAGMKRHWREVLQYGDGRPDAAIIRGCYQRLASLAHPDRAGGSTERMAELNQARDDALKELS